MGEDRNRGMIRELMDRFFLLTALKFIRLSRNTKRFLALFVDSCSCVIATWIALYLRLDEFVNVDTEFVFAALLSIALAIPIFVFKGLYKNIFRYSGLPAVATVAQAITIYGIGYSVVIMGLEIGIVPRTVGVIQPLILLLAIIGSRLLGQFWLGGIDRMQRKKDSLQRVAIYGAGSAGRKVVSILGKDSHVQVVCFLDDDTVLHGQFLNGVEIFNPVNLPDVIASNGLTHILLAMPSISRLRRNEILNAIAGSRVTVRTIPSLADITEGRVSVSEIRGLDIDDLLGRDVVTPNYTLLSKDAFEKVVLITGAGGSIGSELCRQIMKIKPAQLLLVESAESALYGIYSELEKFPEATGSGQYPKVVPLLASVLDEVRMRHIIETWRPDTIYHAAAHKHVPLVEQNIAEGVKNNVFGTLNTVQAAVANNVSSFVLISTDKAVRPTNVMGASKRLSELCLQALNAKQMAENELKNKYQSEEISPIKVFPTRLSMVRFGNVLDSSGSVIPKFRKQISDGGPITLTHPDMTRYFMTIPEAAQLVIQAGAMSKGGDVFLLEMGEPVKILDLAHRMIELSGLTVRDREKNPDGDIEIVLTGLRPGEKLYEELLLGDDPEPTQHPKILRAKDEFIPWGDLETNIGTLRRILSENNIEAVVHLLQKLVGEYQPIEHIADWTYRVKSRRSVSETSASSAKDLVL